jgi:Aldolase/RraA
MLQQRFAALTTAHLADACIRAQVPVRCASALLRAVVPGSRLAGRVCPARHAGSVDAFLEAFETAAPGDVLVVDNGGLLDEACVGDLVALEAHAAGMEGMVIWGLHRDTADIRAIGLPVFSLGAIPTGPLRLDARPPGALESAQQTAQEAHIQIAFLPFRAPELMPCEDLWRQLKAVVAANRVYADIVELVERALAWLDAIPPEDCLRRTGLTSSKFAWLPT